MSGQSGGHRLRLSMLNDQLTCKLCGGYFIDATTIIECLHSFCRSCIVKYLENNKYCPICEVQVHKSKPLLNIRPDHTLQDIVYKLVPACYQNEMRCRREFYAKNPEALRSTTSPEARGEPVESHIYSPDESLILSLEYYNPVDQPILGESGVDDAKESSGGAKKQLEQKDQQLQQKPLRYLRCPAAVMVFHLQKLIRAKYGLSDAHRVDVMYKEETLCDNYTLMDVMYIYHWRRKVPLHLSYRIFESSPKRLKLSEDNENFKQSLTNAGIKMPVDSRGESHGQQQQQQQQQQGGPGGKREWKEVQLKISETGVMSVTDITSPDAKKNAKTDKKTPGNSASSTMEDRRKQDEFVTPDDVNKNEKSMPDAKREKMRDGRFSSTETSKTSEEKFEARKTENSTKSVETPMERDTSFEKSTVRETRSRSDLRSAANSQESGQNVPGEKPVQRPGAETRRSKMAAPETSGTSSSEKVNTISSKGGNSERVSAIPATEEGKTDTRCQSRVTATNNNLTNSTINSRVSTSSEDISTPTQTSNNKNSKNQETKNSQQTSAGSKIDALSAKLQFQPKVSELNNTFSKKGPKEKRIDKIMKKSSTQASLSSVALTSVTSSSALASPSSSSSFSNESSLTVKTLGKNSETGLLKTRSNSGSGLTVTSGKSAATTSSTGSQIINCLGGATTISTTSSTSPSSVSISVTTVPRPSDNSQANSGDRRLTVNSEDSNLAITSSAGILEHRQQGSPSSNQNLSKNCFSRRENQNLAIPSSESLASIGLNVSTSMQTATSNFPYTVQDLVNSGILKNSSGTTKSGLTIQKTSSNFGNAQVSNSSSSLVSSSLSQSCSGVGTSFNLHTPSMSIYSIPSSLSSSSSMKTTMTTATTTTITTTTTSSSPSTTIVMTTGSTTAMTATTTMTTTTPTTAATATPTPAAPTITTPTKNSPSGNIASSLYSNASTQITNSSSGNKVSGIMGQQTSGAVSKSNSLEITSVYSTVPPCPDAIPISLMKSSVRKHEVIAKGTNVNEICAKIGTTGGSKINDICAKIGENTKEKNKAESAARNRPEIPDLLKIGKKPLQSSSLSLSEGVTTKHIPNIPNVPIYTPSNTVASSAETKMYSGKESTISKLSSSPLASVMQSGALQVTKTSGTGGKKPSMSMGYKTLRDPPKSWNPTLTKNNYVAMKNQAKESLQSQQSTMITMQQQQQEGGNGKAISIKPAKRHNRNVPRFLGNPASGVKPLYGVTEGGKNVEGKDLGAITTSGTPGSGKNSSMSLTKVDPKTLSPIVSSSNSPIVSPPPYSPSARGTCYQTTPFSREMCVSRGGGGSPISTRSSPVNILSTNPFIPSPTPNTNPRLIYPHFPPPFPDASRFPNPLIRSPIGIPPPSAFHNSLPPSINKIYQRTSYMPQTTGVYSQPQQQISQSPAIQRIPASTGHPSSSPSPKSPKKPNSPGASFSLPKTETAASIAASGSGGAHGEGKNVILLGNKGSSESNAFNLSKSAVTSSTCQQEERQQNPGDYEKNPGDSEKIGKQTSPSQGKRETSAGKLKDREAEKQRRLSGDSDKGKCKEDSSERLEISAKRIEDQAGSDSGKAVHGEKTGDKAKETSDGDSSQKNTEKVVTKVNGDVNSDNKSSSLTKTQQESLTKNESKDSRASECLKANLTQSEFGCKESEGKTVQISQPGKESVLSEKVDATKECEKKVEDHIGKTGGQIQGKTNKTTNAESQRGKAES